MTSSQIKGLKRDDSIAKFNEALQALEIADSIISKQADTILATTNELVYACANNRKSTKLDSNSGENRTTYADTVKNPQTYPIIVKNGKDDLNFNASDTKKKICGALSNVHVNSTRVTRNGDLIVSLPNSESSQKATDNLNAIFKDVIIEPARKILPKLTVMGLPADYNTDNLKNNVGEKDSTLRDMITNGTFEIIKCWEIKDDSEEVKCKKIAIKVSPDIRNYIVSRNNGYLYIDLLRCKVFDRLVVTQCYHCYEYHHIAKNCPKKAKSPTCGRCAANHETKNCRSRSENCSNCMKTRPNEVNNHCAYSFKCPYHEREKALLQQKTEYIGEKN